MSEGISFNITPSTYLFRHTSFEGCYLGIKPTPIYEIILGDIFLQNYIVIFDKEENKIGFIENFTPLTPFIDNENLIYAFKFVQVGLLLSGVAVLLLTMKKKKVGEVVRQYETPRW